MGRLKLRPLSAMIWATDAPNAAAMVRRDSELDVVV
jgi:hypothetical protein